MKNNEYITAKPVNDTSAHLLEKYFAPLRKECRFCDAQMVPTGNHPTSCRLPNDHIQELPTKGILQARPPSVAKNRIKQGGGGYTKTTIMAEREGFEPSIQFYSYTFLAGKRFRPLSHLSKVKNLTNTDN